MVSQGSLRTLDKEDGVQNHIRILEGKVQTQVQMKQTGVPVRVLQSRKWSTLFKEPKPCRTVDFCFGSQKDRLSVLHMGLMPAKDQC